MLQGALLGDITKGTKLKKAQTNDRSAPQVGKGSGAALGPPTGGAPPIPGLGKPPTGLAPPTTPGSGALNRGRSNSDTGSGGKNAAELNVAPQLGGIFAGVGIPKLRKTGGGVDTGANRDPSYASDPEISRKTPPKPPTSSAPKPPTAPRLNALRPNPRTTESSPPPQSSNPIVANLRKPPPKPAQRPLSDNSFRSNTDLPPRAPPPPPSAPKPPPPIAIRKPSTAALPPAPSSASTHPSVPPPPPSPAPRPPTNVTPPPPVPPPAPPPPPVSSPRSPSVRPTPPPPSNSHPSPNDNISQSVAMQAARNAFRNDTGSPAAPPPPPPQVSSPLKYSNPASPPVSTLLPPVKSALQASNKTQLDSDNFTLPNGAAPIHISSPSRERKSTIRDGPLWIDDSRFQFQEESQLPKPRDFVGGPKRYRAGRGSSVPLDLSHIRS